MSPRLAASATPRTSRPSSLACSTDERVLAQADDDVHAGVLEVLGVGVALGAEADDRDGLAVEEGEVCVVVVEHEARERTAQASAAATQRAGRDADAPVRLDVRREHLVDPVAQRVMRRPG